VKNYQLLIGVRAQIVVMECSYNLFCLVIG